MTTSLFAAAEMNLKENKGQDQVKDFLQPSFSIIIKYPMTISGGLQKVAVITNVAQEHRLKRIGETMQDNGHE